VITGWEVAYTGVSMYAWQPG